MWALVCLLEELIQTTNRALRAHIAPNGARKKTMIKQVLAAIENRPRLTVIVILAILFVVSLGLITFKVAIAGVNVGAILLALIISYLIFSFGTVKGDEVGMMTFFGKPILDLSKGFGLYFAPFGVMSVQKFPGIITQQELPADPEKIFRGEGLVPDGMYPPIRIKFGTPDLHPKNEADADLLDDPYHIAMVMEVVPVVSWKITEPMKFFMSMGNPDNCRQIFSDRAVELAGEVFKNRTPAQAILHLPTINEEMLGRLSGEAKQAEWGVKFDQAFFKPPIFPHSLNTAVIGVSIKQQDAIARRHEAEGQADAVKIAAKAEKKRLIRVGLAKTDKNGRITKLLPDPNTRVTMDAVSNLANVKGTVVLGGLTPVLDVGRSGQQQEPKPKDQKDGGGK